MTDKGFTLIEMLVAVTVSALLLTTTYGIVTSVSRTRDRLSSDGEGFHLARVINERLARELRGAYYSPTSAGSLFAGGLDESGAPFLQLATTAATPASGGSGIVVVRYRLADDGEGEKVLLRDEYPLNSQLPSEGPEQRLAAGINNLQLRFRSGGDWQPDWRSTEQGGLPDLVELTLTVKGADGLLPFLTAIELAPLQKSL
ncbi:MAG: prepilin-type N-terminal cleavage/methylation domain-containing protein [Desulfuromonadaceae bacterium]|nr:prepilin-type N-terminal cleavage/methylation domain-containing protein [Desulfuromonadaceae bacterium]